MRVDSITITKGRLGSKEVWRVEEDLDPEHSNRYLPRLRFCSTERQARSTAIRWLKRKAARDLRLARQRFIPIPDNEWRNVCK